MNLLRGNGRPRARLVAWGALAVAVTLGPSTATRPVSAGPRPVEVSLARDDDADSRNTASSAGARVPPILMGLVAAAIALWALNARITVRRLARRIEAEAERRDRDLRDGEARHRAMLGAERRRLDAALLAVADGVIITDPKRRVVSINPPAEAIAGWRAEAALGRRLDDVLPGLGPEPTSSRRPFDLVRPDGETRRIEFSQVAISDRRDGDGGLALAFREVTAQAAVDKPRGPRPEGEPAEATTLRAPEDSRSGEGRILVLDDDEMVRDTIGLMLASRGYAVDCAAEGAEAIALYAAALRSERRYDAVIVDLSLAGGMGGHEVAERLGRLDPQVKAIVASGSSNHPLLADPARHGFAGRVDKPFRARDLLEVLARVLAAGSHPTPAGPDRT